MHGLGAIVRQRLSRRRSVTPARPEGGGEGSENQRYGARLRHSRPRIVEELPVVQAVVVGARINRRLDEDPDPRDIGQGQEEGVPVAVTSFHPVELVKLTWLVCQAWSGVVNAYSQIESPAASDSK